MRRKRKKKRFLFKEHVPAHYKLHGRDLPWRKTRDPEILKKESILLSEIRKYVLMQSDTPIEQTLRLDDGHKKALRRLRLRTVRDLLYHFPSRYVTVADIKYVKDLEKGDHTLLYGKLTNLKTKKAFRKKIPLAEARFSDDTGSIDVVWFHQPYIAKMVSEGQLVKMEGKVSEKNGKVYITNPEFERVKSLPEKVGDSLFGKGEKQYSIPVYPESRGITSKWIYHTIQKVLKEGVAEEIDDPIPQDILDEYNLPPLEQALFWVHLPRSEKNMQAARKRFSFEEVFLIQLQKQRDRLSYEAQDSFTITKDRDDIAPIIDAFPFEPTSAQDRTISEILRDFSTPHAMSRLLEGDVGSGKTAVAAATAYAVVTSRPLKPDGSGAQDFGNLQVAYMAPTEILARQHFESFIEFFSHLPIQIGLITSSGCYKFPSKVDPEGFTKISRSQLLKWVKNGEIAILVGTHSLIQKTVEFSDLAYVIIDEQHRFGVNQRFALARGKKQNKSTQKNAEISIELRAENSKLIYEQLTYQIIGAAFEVRKALGQGHKESVYQKALAVELMKRKLTFKREVPLPVYYSNEKVGTYQPDFVVNDKVIIELKALPRISQQAQRQTWDYLRGTSYKLALLINFGGKELTIKRIVYDQARDLPRSSESGPRDSAQKMHLPHLLSMTATPIPRTLALTIYGDLDLTLLDELPKGRKPVETELVPPQKRKEVYERVREKLREGRQAYVICPRIEEPHPDKENALILKSVNAEAKRLGKKVFPEFSVAKLHGKQTAQKKEKVMKQFEEGEIDVLVATSVVEVGVNVPNATTIIIEGAERFGLAQLHQLRGRVQRSSHQAHCYLFTDSKSEKTQERLLALKHAKNGFDLAEEDLRLRGPGELVGRRQWGVSDIGMEALKNLAMVEVARKEARELVENDPEFSAHPTLKKRILEKKTLHFE